LDRIPEVRTLREKLEWLCPESGRAARWNTELAREWIAAQRAPERVFYTDGHVRVYHGDLTALPRHYVARQRLCLRGTTDYWINALDGQPFFFVNKEVDPGLLATLRQDLVPWLETHVPLSPEQKCHLEQSPLQHRFTLVFDREAYSPDFFREMKERRIAILTYQKYPGEPWPPEEFAACRLTLVGGEQVTMRLAERGTQLSNGLWVREVRKLSEAGTQSSMLSTNYRADLTGLAASMLARWCQENFYKYMREHYNLDRIIEYGTEPIPDTVRVVNPAWRELDAQVRSKNGQRQRQLALFGALQLEGALSEEEVGRYQQEKSQRQELIEQLSQQIDQLKLQRKETSHHIPVQELPEPQRFTRLLTEKKHFIVSVKQGTSGASRPVPASWRYETADEATT
jgi:hypothetical protein